MVDLNEKTISKLFITCPNFQKKPVNSTERLLGPLTVPRLYSRGLLNREHKTRINEKSGSTPPPSPQVEVTLGEDKGHFLADLPLLVGIVLEDPTSCFCVNTGRSEPENILQTFHNLSKLPPKSLRTVRLLGPL